MTTTTSLPRIVRFVSRYDSGEFGNATCPHCGAQGRYVETFLCDDGTERGAMAGCIKRFPVSKIATEERSIRERQVERERDGRTLASWDRVKAEKIAAYYAGDLTEGQCLAWIADENAKRSEWMRNRRR